MEYDFSSFSIRSFTTNWLSSLARRFLAVSKILLVTLVFFFSSSNSHMSVNIDVDVVARVVAIENVAAAVFIIIYPYTSYYVRAAQRASAHPDFEVSYPGYVV